MEEALACPTSLYVVDVDDHNSRSNYKMLTITKKQGAKEMNYKVGDRVLVYMPHKSTGKLHRQALPALR